MNQWNWPKLAETMEGHYFETMREAAVWLGIPYSTVKDAFHRGDLPISALVSPADPINEEPGQIEFTKRGNNAKLKYNSAEPLSAEEAMEISGVDPEEWKVESERINMWQMGRKDKQVKLTWKDGRMEGSVWDEGEIKKTYLYQIEIELTRKKRIAVKPVIQPIELTFPTIAPPLPNIGAKGMNTILFIADPHFGFRQTWNGLEPMQHREFLTSLLHIAEQITPDMIVWNGDVLDLADFGSFDTEPALLQSTQLAGVELAWLLGQFRQLCHHQIVLEGNHEVRLQKALVKNLAAGYQLAPVHDIGGAPLMSIPRFLGLDRLETEWIDGYPDNYLQVGHVRFYHGKVVRRGSGKTLAAEITDATTSRFFGHIHRFEMATKYIEDSGIDIWVGSPGYACDKRNVPGSNMSHNWQLGAFLIHIGKTSGTVQSVEHIKGGLDGLTWFRGDYLGGANYFENFWESLPENLKNAF